MEVLTAVDTTHKYAPNIPADDPAIGMVCGYDTQNDPNSEIKWTSADWGRLTSRYIKKEIAQLPSGDPLAADILDVEAGAGTVSTAVTWAQGRHALKRPAHLYADAALVPTLRGALAAANVLEQSYLCLANWNLDEAEARALLGTEYQGMKVEMVQWASPTSNPGTLMPGTSFTLREVGCDLSVAIPFSVWQEPAVRLVSVVIVATYSDGSKRSVTL